MDNKVVEEGEIVDAIRSRASSVHVIVAGGRGLDPLIQEADLVTEVTRSRTCCVEIAQPRRS